MDFEKLAAMLIVMEKIDRFPVIAHEVRQAAHDQIHKMVEEAKKEQEKHKR